MELNRRRVSNLVAASATGTVVGPQFADEASAAPEFTSDVLERWRLDHGDIVGVEHRIPDFDGVILKYEFADGTVKELAIEAYHRAAYDLRYDGTTEEIRQGGRNSRRSRRRWRGSPEMVTVGEDTTLTTADGGDAHHETGFGPAEADARYSLVEDTAEVYAEAENGSSLAEAELWREFSVEGDHGADATLTLEGSYALQVLSYGTGDARVEISAVLYENGDRAVEHTILEDRVFSDDYTTTESFSAELSTRLVPGSDYRMSLELWTRAGTNFSSSPSAAIIDVHEDEGNYEGGAAFEEVRIEFPEETASTVDGVAAHAFTTSNRGDIDGGPTVSPPNGLTTSSRSDYRLADNRAEAYARSVQWGGRYQDVEVGRVFTFEGEEPRRSLLLLEGAYRIQSRAASPGGNAETRTNVGTFVYNVTEGEVVSENVLHRSEDSTGPDTPSYTRTDESEFLVHGTVTLKPGETYFVGVSNYVFTRTTATNVPGTPTSSAAATADNHASDSPDLTRLYTGYTEFDLVDVQWVDVGTVEDFGAGSLESFREARSYFGKTIRCNSGSISDDVATFDLTTESYSGGYAVETAGPGGTLLGDSGIEALPQLAYCTVRWTAQHEHWDLGDYGLVV